jgi:hypothetical protein
MTTPGQAIEYWQKARALAWTALAILEQVGVPQQIIGHLFVLLTIGVYAGIGFITRTAQVSEYYVAGRRVPALHDGMAQAAGRMSAASFIGTAGSLCARGYDGLAFVLGWTGGCVLVAMLTAPCLRKFGAYTVPDFPAARCGGNFARLVGVVILVACSFVYLMGQLTGTGLIASRLIGIPLGYGGFVGLAGILVCSMLGGTRGHLDADGAVQRPDRGLSDPGRDPLRPDHGRAAAAAHVRVGSGRRASSRVWRGSNDRAAAVGSARTRRARPCGHALP